MSEHMGSLSERMAEAARELQEHQDDPDATMELATQLAKQNIGHCDAAGLSMVRRGRTIETRAATDDLVLRADRLQHDIGEGPCLDSIWLAQTVYSPRLAEDPRWPTWGPRVAMETDAQSVLAFQLFTHEDTLGALNLYSRTEDAFKDDDREEGLAIAAHIAIAVAAAQKVEHMTRARDVRTIIGQASGILMERYDLDEARAFEVLARLSSHGNIKVRDVAAELVRTRQLPQQH